MPNNRNILQHNSTVRDASNQEEITKKRAHRSGAGRVSEMWLVSEWTYASPLPLPPAPWKGSAGHKAVGHSHWPG